MKKYRCLLCGYEVELEGEMPDDYVCPFMWCRQRRV